MRGLRYALPIRGGFLRKGRVDAIGMPWCGLRGGADVKISRREMVLSAALLSTGCASMKPSQKPSGFVTVKEDCCRSMARRIAT